MQKQMREFYGKIVLSGATVFVNGSNFSIHYIYDYLYLIRVRIGFEGSTFLSSTLCAFFVVSPGVSASSMTLAPSK